ncbi:hypothetical protein [Legionella drancourtii]|uniref:Uncharacterized protein n=1 Tax=Legionella drancourtii LLAP12 TaxID=658187 RepID=G9EJZ3_9GAMM|nr:hypothetical protein [Legionella drancourtii]EHL32553.1 hypothetical protein LDG_5513 [Legionella drancourtii LLAP12]
MSKNMLVFNIAKFNPSKNTKIGTGAKFSHKVCRGTLKDNPKTWISKEMPDPVKAKIELLSQEFFRLLIPHQPETLIARNSVTGTYYILSEEVIGYRNLPKGEAHNFANGRYHGLGQITVGALYLQEIDLKNGNIGLDEQNKAIKIDGDWCFAESRFRGRYKLTPLAIAQLPYPSKDNYTFNWLEVVKENVYQAKSSIIAPTLANSTQFRAEANEALLKISLIPNRYLAHFVDKYMPAGGSYYLNLLQARRDELTMSACQNPSFSAYLKTPAARLEAVNFLHYLKEFKAAGSPIIPQEEHARLELDFKILRDKLIPTVPAKATNASRHRDSVSELHAKCQQLLTQIKMHAHPKDRLLQQYIRLFELNLKCKSHNINELYQLQTDIKPILAIINSPEVAAVKKTIQTLRISAGFFTLHKNNKANQIEDALFNTPLEARSKIISSTKINAVQEALASHRHLGKRGTIYKTTDRDIDESKAARSFKDLKALFKNTPECIDYKPTLASESRQKI